MSPLTAKLLNLKVAVGSGTTTAVSGVRSGYRRVCTGSTAAYKAVAMDGQVRSSEGTDLLPWIFPTAEKRRQLRLLVMLVFARLIVLAFTNYYAGLCSANLTRALESKDPDRFLYSLRWVLFFWPINVVLGYCSRYTNSRLVATIQMANMQTLSKALYSNREAVARPFYRLQFVEGGKTPEFQLIQDSMEYGGVFVNILVTMANTAVAPMYLAEAVQMHSQRFYVFFALLIVSTLIQAVVFTRIIGHIDWLIWEKVNNVRSVLTRVLSNVEAIALFRGGDAEMLRVRRVHSMVWNCRLDWARRYSIVIAWGIFQSSGFMLFPVFSVIRELLSGRSNVSDIQRFLAVLAGGGAPLLALFSLGPQFTQITVNKGRILHILRETERIHEEAARLKRITEKGQPTKEFIVTHENDGQDRSAVFELRDVTIRTPPLQHSVGNLLIEGLSLRMGVGDSLLIVGDSGVGKSALLFAISGVWASGRGEIQRCRRSGVLCLPQRPFTFLGSLRQQLLYPDLDDTQTSNDELWGVLSTLNLERHLRQHGLDKIASWADVLSPGQQQRISVARALLAAGRVRLLLLDEATAALDLHNERIVYEALLQCRPHCLVSVGHRPSLRKYHQRVLTLKATETEDGGTCTTHTVSTLPPAPPSAKAGQAAAESHLAEAQQADAASPATLPSHEEIPTGEVQRQPKNWLPEPYNTVVACFYEIWRPLKEANPMVMKDSKKNVLYGLGASAVGTTAGIYSYQLTIKMIAALTERLEEETYSHLWKLLLLGLVPVFSSPLVFYNFATIFSSNAERLRLFLLERFLGGPDAAYYSMRLQGGLHDDNPADILTGADCDLVILTWLFLASFSGSIVAICVSVVRLLVWSPMMTLGLLVPVAIAVPMSIRSMQYAMLHNLNATGLRASICVRVAHARENAEAVALLDGGPAEQRQLDRMAAKFITAGQSVEFVNLDLGTYIGILSTLFNHLNTCFVGFKVISGEVKIIEYYDTAMMIGIAFYIINTVKILCGERVMPNFVSCRRVRELMSRINSAKDHVNSGGIQLTEHPEEKVVLELRCIQLALMQNARTKQLQQQLLLTRVSARLWEGESLLIVGESGLGKSSLLRAIAGICTAGSGQIYCPQKDHVMFFAQRPYLCFGTLREQLLYPHVERQMEDKPLKAALKAVDLEHLLESPGLGSAAETPEETEAALKESQRWTSQLSLGEIQRLGFARLLLREGVRLTLFDEGTSALDLKHEATLYSLLTGNTRSYVSVAHRPQLYQWHSHVLVLEQNSQGQALGVSRFSDMAHYRQELEGLGAHRSEKTGLRLQPADGHTANGANGAGGKSENGASHANGVHVRP